ncbi:MAG: AAA family ATPase [Gemmatimonadales bacterium]|nr:AAA family ATPase [Gemmatimonadales bacterium]
MTAFLRLEDLLADPSLLEPPPVVIPRLAWAGRLTLLAAPEKSGKSTLVGQAVAAKATGGEFLGERIPQGTVLWLGVDEPLNDIVRRFDRYGARDHIVIGQAIPGAQELREAIGEINAAAVVIDTLAEFARGFVDDYNAASQWVGLLGTLRGVLQATGAGGILLHHTVKGGRTYRDSTQIGAGVDAILEMTPADEDPAVRVVRTRGRMTMADFRMRFTDPWYQLDGTELPLELRVYRVIVSNPGMGRARVRGAVYGSTAVDRALADLCSRGAIEDRRNGSTAHAFFPRPAE